MLKKQYLEDVKSTGFPSRDHLTLIGLSPSGLQVNVTGRPTLVVKLAPSDSKCTGSRNNLVVEMLRISSVYILHQKEKRIDVL